MQQESSFLISVYANDITNEKTVIQHGCLQFKSGVAIM
jgi:hypothetical protein